MDDISLDGVIDLHIHTAPDIEPRRLDDLDLARAAAAAGMRAVLVKSHDTLTADRAALVERVVPGIRVFGGLALNEAVGGLNPAAVEVALRMGAKEIWMPTRSAANHQRARGKTGGISILNDANAVKPEVFEILALIAQYDVMLGTGHLSVNEIVRLVPAALEAGVQRVVITHPELSVVNMPVAVQRELARPNVFFERCLLPTLSARAPVPLAAIAAAIREVGPESTVLATDLGQLELPTPVDGLRQYIAGLRAHGVPQHDIERMTCHNPAWLLGL